MAKIKITFQRIIQDSQDHGSDDKHMVSRAFSHTEVDGVNRGDFGDSYFLTSNL